MRVVSLNRKVVYMNKGLFAFTSGSVSCNSGIWMLPSALCITRFGDFSASLGAVYGFGPFLS